MSLPSKAEKGQQPAQALPSSTVDIIIGDAVIRTGAEIDEAHLARVIRAVRSA
ncbi:hypothetical protein [Rhizobium sullae]|uniref:hypothetical protein n=1 Tax=Rhizobium sullae TaxID=50338 RepID=UPI001FE06DF2